MNIARNGVLDHSRVRRSVQQPSTDDGNIQLILPIASVNVYVDLSHVIQYSE